MCDMTCGMILDFRCCQHSSSLVQDIHGQHQRRDIWGIKSTYCRIHHKTGLETRQIQHTPESIIAQSPLSAFATLLLLSRGTSTLSRTHKARDTHINGLSKSLPKALLAYFTYFFFVVVFSDSLIYWKVGLLGINFTAFVPLKKTEDFLCLFAFKLYD